jgi:hypothetical protein
MVEGFGVVKGSGTVVEASGTAVEASSAVAATLVATLRVAKVPWRQWMQGLPLRKSIREGRSL